MADCCLKGLRWEAKTKGRDENVAGLNCYATGSNKDVAIIVIHDLFGWTFENIRILADHFAEEVDATVYVPDCFGGEVLPTDILLDRTRFNELDLGAFLKRNSRSVREPEIIRFAESLRSSYSRIGAIGYCYGGWAVFHLAAKGKNLVDCISTAHPSMLEKQDITNINVPTQIIAPEFDHIFTEELKAYSLGALPKTGVAYDYQYFPGLEHGFAIRGDPGKLGEREGMERAKNAASLWFREWLH
ncbi:putative hydrolase [Dactylonectria macrodidyma]|uniref:Hydrolase n=1 Tax=Dactylonectria macrodidyma TaxID=307937 RepID=A0A9P9IZM6_9HYPO|nr:putative hydrolase [Dactylonectria macrodidyma]